MDKLQDKLQHEFLPGRSTIDLIFALKMIYEKNGGQQQSNYGINWPQKSL